MNASPLMARHRDRLARWLARGAAIARAGVRAGATVGAAIAVAAAPALALTEEEVADRLQVVPVFTVVGSDGSPLVVFPQNDSSATTPDPSEGWIVSFLDPEAVQNFMRRLYDRSPERLQGASIYVSSLGETYRWQQENAEREDSPRFIYSPFPEEVEAALQLLQQQGQDLENFPGVPLFSAVGGDGNGYLTMTVGNEQVVPFFLRKDDLQALLDRFREQAPEVANGASIQVVSLNSLIQELEDGSSDDAFIRRVRIIPARESLEFLQSLEEERSSGEGSPDTPAGATP